MNVDLSLYALRIPALLIAITVHEYAHARVAYAFGDTTAKDLGRLSLNPLNHLDPIGTLMLIVAGFGWAKPVPINPYRFRNYRRGLLWVSLAGPLANFILAFVAMIPFYILYKNGFFPFSIAGRLVFVLVWLNLILGVFNLIPIPPLDGSKILTSLAPRSFVAVYRQIEPYAPLLLLGLIIFGVFDWIISPLVWIFFDAMLLLMQYILG